MKSELSNVLAAATVFAFDHPVRIQIVVGDVLTSSLDVLALKYAQNPYGADREALLRLGMSNAAAELPAPGQVLVTEGGNRISASRVMFVGTAPLEFFDYAAIREFARRAVAEVGNLGDDLAHLGMTMHGVGAGLDEGEALSAQLAGLIDALHARECPEELTTVSIIEMDRRRAERMVEVLQGALSQHMVDALHSSTMPKPQPTGVSYDLTTAGWGSRNKKHVFVAMQFGPDTEDLFHYGIEAAVKASGFLCERIDQVSFTGDILSQIRNRIDSATFVVADVSSANPNVYLEVGYAWGRNVKTILLVRDASQLRFDIQGQRCVIYSSIRDLETKLTEELRRLSFAT